MSEQRPRVDGRDPGQAIEEMVEHVLGLAETWLGWDGKPVWGLGREYTPHKAVRRVADHMIDHLAQLDARLAGVPSLPDEWHASAITTDGDMAPFSIDDLDEARSRLWRRYGGSGCAPFPSARWMLRRGTTTRCARSPSVPSSREPMRMRSGR